MMGHWESIKEVMEPGKKYTSRELADLIYPDDMPMRKRMGITGWVNDTLLKAEKYGLVKLVGLNWQGFKVWERVAE